MKDLCIDLSILQAIALLFCATFVRLLLKCLIALTQYVTESDFQKEQGRESEVMFI